MDQGVGGVCIGASHVTSGITDLVDVIFFVKGKGEGKDVVLLMVGTAIVEDILGGNPLPERKRSFVKCAACSFPLR